MTFEDTNKHFRTDKASPVGLITTRESIPYKAWLYHCLPYSSYTKTNTGRKIENSVFFSEFNTSDNLRNTILNLPIYSELTCVLA